MNIIHCRKSSAYFSFILIYTLKFCLHKYVEEDESIITAVSLSSLNSSSVIFKTTVLYHLKLSLMIYQLTTKLGPPPILFQAKNWQNHLSCKS